ncbi:hypothetical protein LTR66_008583 [Elasticomyces elasticus]|nr:hypothetical protein LTR66_008583 [Elasticomyces elasticus]
MASETSTAPPPQRYTPNSSLYLSNLPDKLPKEELRRSLYYLFTTYGSVLDIVALKTPKLRGQAHVLFKDVTSATMALRALQGFEFFGKKMADMSTASGACGGGTAACESHIHMSLEKMDVADETHSPKTIQYAKTKSDYLAKLDGTYRAPGTTSTDEAPQSSDTAGAELPSVFAAPPGAGPPPALSGPPSLPAKSAAAVNGDEEEVASPQGVKRPREEDSDEGEEQGEAEMEIDEDDAMEESDEDD